MGKKYVCAAEKFEANGKKITHHVYFVDNETLNMDDSAWWIIEFLQYSNVHFIGSLSMFVMCLCVCVCREMGLLLFCRDLWAININAQIYNMEVISQALSDNKQQGESKKNYV